VHKLLRTAVEVTMGACFDRGDSLRNMYYHGLKYFPYQSHEMCLINDKPLDALVCVAFRNKATNDVKLSVFPRHKEWTECAAFWTFLYIFHDLCIQRPGWAWIDKVGLGGQ
jgi:hypothetical protein